MTIVHITKRHPRAIATTTLVVCLLALPSLTSIAHAAEPSEALCRQRINQELTQVTDDYRSHLFGSVPDTQGRFVVKTGGTTDKARTGIFERSGRLTSEFIHPLIESYRAYRCESLMVCYNLQQSLGSASTAQTMRIPGCVDKTLSPYPECNASNNTINDVRTLLNHCTTTMNDTLLFERNVLTLATAYDAGYRADVLQFPGMVDWLIHDMPTRNFLPLRAMVNLLGKLHQIPCFSAQCDMPNTDSLTIRN